MTYRITINDPNYTTCSIEPPLDNIDPLTLKLFNENAVANNGLNKYLLKISGIWENENEYGITFKFGD